MIGVVRINLLMLLLIAVVTGCIENLGVFNSEEEFLIVEGSITNEVKEHVIKLAVTQQFNTAADYSRVEYADVFLIDDLGGLIQLRYAGAGRYYTESDFFAKIGRSYQLKVILQDGTSILSSFEKVAEPVDISNAYYHLETEDYLSEEDVLTTRQLVVFYADFEDDESSKNYYRWDYEEQFQVLAPLVGTGFGGTTSGGRGNCPRIVPNKDCWAKQRAHNYLNMTGDALIQGKSVTGHRVYGTTIGRKFAEGFSTEIKLLNLNKEEFDYWKSIDEQLKNKGTLFEKGNYQIEGNISFESSDDLVLGYFGASSVSKSRVYISPSDLDYTYNYICEANEVGCFPQACLDCRSYSNSSVTEQPVDWPWE